MKLCKEYYLMDAFGIFALFLGVSLVMGAYTPHGLHTFVDNCPTGIDGAFAQIEFGIIFIIAAIFCIFVGRRTTRHKYYSIERVRARDFRRQIFSNGTIITYADREKAYMFQLPTFYTEVYKDRWYKNEHLGLKRYYNNQKNIKEVLVLYNKKYK